MKSIRTNPTIENMLIKSNALLTGHFLLSSGLHSNKYVQCAKFFQHPEYSQEAAKQLAKMYKGKKIDVVIGGAFGGIIIAYAIGEVLGTRAIFAERVDNVFALRRGFEIKEGENVLIAEDVVTTGKSIREVIDLVNEHKGNIIGIASLIDRNMDEPEDIDYRIEWLYSVQAEAFTAEKCLMCAAGEGKPIKPGSRKQ